VFGIRCNGRHGRNIFVFVETYLISVVINSQINDDVSNRKSELANDQSSLWLK
jgi:hypothetical protein